jgi:ketosteroid isomerase-like protein
MRPGIFLLAAVVMLADPHLGAATAPDTPQSTVDELIAADRAFSAKGAKENVATSLAAMFADDVIMPVPPGEFKKGKADAVAALNANPDNVNGHVEWTPARGGVSADGQHGFTVGYMTLRRQDGTTMPLKYLSYWVKGPQGWRVAVYKRGRGAAGDRPTAMLAPAVPARLIAPSQDTAAIERLKQSLDAAERAFSDEAQRIGLGPAFAKHGSADAVNMGGPVAAFVVGADAIGKIVDGDRPEPTSAVAWAPDVAVLVASSGDVGVTLGTIRPHKPAAGQPAATPFITIWRRASVNDPWKYVAE